MHRVITGDWSRLYGIVSRNDLWNYSILWHVLIAFEFNNGAFKVNKTVGTLIASFFGRYYYIASLIMVKRKNIIISVLKFQTLIYLRIIVKCQKYLRKLN